MSVDNTAILFSVEEKFSTVSWSYHGLPIPNMRTGVTQSLCSIGSLDVINSNRLLLSLQVRTAALIMNDLFLRLLSLRDRGTLGDFSSSDTFRTVVYCALLGSFDQVWMRNKNAKTADRSLTSTGPVSGCCSANDFLAVP